MGGGAQGGGELQGVTCLRNAEALGPEGPIASQVRRAPGLQLATEPRHCVLSARYRISALPSPLSHQRLSKLFLAHGCRTLYGRLGLCPYYQSNSAQWELQAGQFPAYLEQARYLIDDFFCP